MIMREWQTLYEEIGVDAEVVPFLYDMPQVLRAADLVIARSGAGTLAELAVCGKPAILIPFPHATHGHQEKNARAAEAEGAAIVLLQSELTGGRLVQEIEGFLNHPEHLKTMAERSFCASDHRCDGTHGRRMPASFGESLNIDPYPDRIEGNDVSKNSTHSSCRDRGKRDEWYCGGLTDPWV